MAHKNIDEQTGYDVDLLTKIEEHDVKALSSLYDRHSVLLYSVILRILREKTDAEKVLQDLFMAVWDASEKYQPRLGSPSVWLTRLARNLAIHKIRSKGYNITVGNSEEGTYDEFFSGDIAESPERLTLLSPQQEEIMIALSMLSNDQKELIEFAYFRGFTVEEMAAHFQLPPSTVRTKINSSMGILRQKLRHLL